MGRGAAGPAADGPGPAAGLRAVRLYRRRLPAAGARLRGQRLYRPLRGGKLQQRAAGVVSGGGDWGAHEGSLLLWVLLLSVWTFAVALFSRRMPLDAVARVLAVMGMIALGFLLFILFTSNPFSRGLPQYPIDGRDLNPLLQDIGMIFHPPILYMGYVGFSVAFAFAIASLLAGRLDTAWARWSRPPDPGGMDVPHPRHRAGLGVGLLRTGLGRLVVLGPGGKRLVYAVAGGNRAAALPAVTEKRGSFRAWTVLLAIAAFSLCLLGTFWCAPGCWSRCMPSPRIRRAGCLFWRC